MRQGEHGGPGSVLKQDRISLNQAAARVPAVELPRQQPPRPDSQGEPEVHLVKAKDGTVTRITVRCPCGRETTLDCQYPDQGETDGPETA